MGKIILLASEGRRKDFFLKAGRDLNRQVIFLPLFSEEVFTYEDQGNYTIKIDPPTYTSGDYSKFNREVASYLNYLNRLEMTDFKFFNRSSSIEATLDKVRMKEILINKNIRMPKTLTSRVYNTKDLLVLLEESKSNNVFIKPRYGSGALGVMALKCNFKKNGYLMYTSLYKANGNYYNSKKIRAIRDREIIFDLLDRVLQDGPLVEKWIEKKRLEDRPFDIRVLVNYARVDFILGRSSKGPITNLHLNNQALDYESLGLGSKLFEEIEDLAKSAVESFEGLNYAGVDILVNKRDQAYVVEVNGQGDLIHKDIFGHNTIYKNQIERV